MYDSLETAYLVVGRQPGLGGLQEGGLARVVQPQDEHEVLVLLCQVFVQS